jgi:gliding motility-associated lipoprotein GldH
MNMFKYSLLLIFTTICLAACTTSPYFQKEEGIPQNAWDYNFKPSFKFEISDTSAAYSSLFVIRHTDAYPYSNIYLWIYTKQPGDTSYHKTRVNIKLAENSGKWLGRGMGEIYEQYIPINLTEFETKRFFKKKGTYEVKLEQNMRINPLPDVLHAGLRIEKLK